MEIEGPLYVEVAGSWDEAYCEIKGNALRAFRKARPNLPAAGANRGIIIFEFRIESGECEAKSLKFGLAELSKLMKRAKLKEQPFFFSVKSTLTGREHQLAASSDSMRAEWLAVIRRVMRKEKKNDSIWAPRPGFIREPQGSEPRSRFGGGSSPKNNNINNNSNNRNNRNHMLPSQRMGMKVDSKSEIAGVNPLARSRSTQSPKQRSALLHSPSPSPSSGVGDGGASVDGERKSEGSDTAAAFDPLRERDSLNSSSSTGAGAMGASNIRGLTGSSAGDRDNKDLEKVLSDLNDEDGETNKTDWLRAACCCRRRHRLLGIKIDTLSRLINVCTAFPFVIVVATLNLSNQYRFLQSITGIRVMNLLIYAAPFFYTLYVLKEYPYPSVQRIAIGLYALLYLFPVGYVVLSKVRVSRSTSKIEEGTFCFKPARTVRVTQANFYALAGFIFEWIQHTLYVLPLGILTSESATRLSDFPPFFNFNVYFWGTIACTFASALILVLNATLKGKLHYRFQDSYAVWFFLFNVGSPMFVTFVTILFMSLWCDYDTDPPSLVQDPGLICYGAQHIVMARAGLIALAVYIIQNTLLPSGTFKETMRDGNLDIMFSPVYLQAHFLLKAIFCGIYVYFYKENLVRVISLTAINIALLALNNFMKPCSVTWVNVLRDAFLVHAVLSGIQSANYLAWPSNTSTKNMVISTLSSNILFSAIGMYVYYVATARSTEYTIATAFLDLEWQVSRGGSVHPRVLEPLIALSLSSEKEDWDIAKKYIGQLVWLISYPNMRVQFQSAWGLANLALVDEDARMKIHQAGGTKTLFEWYMDMDTVVQLEALAAMCNLTLSLEVSDEMVSRYKCIPFFIDLVASNKLKHAQFAAISLANLARKEFFRELIRRSGGIQTLVGCIMSHDYQKRRHGCRALANMALSSSTEMEQVFESKGLLDRILKMALRQEIETQREVVALIRNLACHSRLRPLLLDRGVMDAVAVSKASVFEDVKHWCDEITGLLQREIEVGSIDLKALLRREGAKGSAIGEADVDLLKKMDPLKGQVEWSTWGSKLERVFAPVFSTVPTLVNSQVYVRRDAASGTQVHLAVGLTRGMLRKWRDSMAYEILERPSHGTLDAYNTVSDHVTYTPHPDFLGTDFFTYHIQLGSMQSAPATVSITVEDAAAFEMHRQLAKQQQLQQQQQQQNVDNRRSNTTSFPRSNNHNNSRERDRDVDGERVQGGKSVHNKEVSKAGRGRLGLRGRGSDGTEYSPARRSDRSEDEEMGLRGGRREREGEGESSDEERPSLRSSDRGGGAERAAGREREKERDRNKGVEMMRMGSTSKSGGRPVSVRAQQQQAAAVSSKNPRAAIRKDGASPSLSRAAERAERGDGVPNAASTIQSPFMSNLLRRMTPRNSTAASAAADGGGETSHSDSEFFDEA